MNANAQPSTEASSASRKEAAGITKRSSAYYADPRTITRRQGFNPRFDFGDIDELATSIKANGLLQPLRVKRMLKPSPQGHVFELIDGDRRLTAIESLIKKDGDAFREDGVPVVIVDKTQDEITDLVQMFVANTGKPFLPMEEAMAYGRMREAGLTIHDICKAVGKTAMHVNDILALLEASPEVKEAVQKGEIGKTQAKHIARHARGDAEAQKKLVATAKQANKGDKKARRALDKGLDDARRAKAAKKGKTLKIRALTDEELNHLGMASAKRMIGLLKNAGKDESTDLLAWIKADDKLALAATYGALQALKAAVGMKTDVNGATITLEF